MLHFDTFFFVVIFNQNYNLVSVETTYFFLVVYMAHFCSHLASLNPAPIDCKPLFYYFFDNLYRMYK